jgi:hypothetical protein
MAVAAAGAGRKVGSGECTHLEHQGLALVAHGLAHVSADGKEARVGPGLNALVSLRIAVPLARGQRELASRAIGLLEVRGRPPVRPLGC